MSNILIVGAAGRMGKWFFEYFINLRNEQSEDQYLSKKTIKVEKIFLVDFNRIEYFNKSEPSNVYASKNITKFIEDSNIIILCTPINETLKIFDKYATKLKPGTVTIEISSVKNPIYKHVSNISKNYGYLKILCIHPMFGPGAQVSSSKNIIMHVPISLSSSSRESKILSKLFPKFKRILIDTPEKHDTLVAILVSLIYFINLVFSKLLIEISAKKTLKNEKDLLKLLKQLSGSSYRIQSLLSESILTDDPPLFLNLFLGSDKSIDIIKKYGKIYEKVAMKVEQRDEKYLQNLVVNTKKVIKNQIDIDNSYDLLYQFLNN
ncbi:MAG: prephenate dehydrogenase/arogenate dehydrogenase family protein [Candidatus Nitrosocosmicus sp.]|nr:prephenate dehydrogenase/arogenate dehydrogenase family protein [Candidatus Nitrosocosmicus sp.]MDN5865810.1 prephenate dehydrogenase/arogenate dehydrogenase family protein [Candidatus Nitrosocosmicus sp.]